MKMDNRQLVEFVKKTTMEGSISFGKYVLHMETIENFYSLVAEKISTINTMVIPDRKSGNDVKFYDISSEDEIVLLPYIIGIINFIGMRYYTFSDGGYMVISSEKINEDMKDINITSEFSIGIVEDTLAIFYKLYAEDDNSYESFVSVNDSLGVIRDPDGRVLGFIFYNKKGE